MKRFKLTLAYDGSTYHGWQIQNHHATIQGEIEAALGRLCQESIRIYGAGRTDAKVHALAQVAHFDSAKLFTSEIWQRGLNALLPQNIVVKEVQAVSETFHARFSAHNKHYRYQVLNAAFRDPMEGTRKWHLSGSLDLRAMDSAAKKLRGQHCFTSFAASSTEVENHEIYLKTLTLNQLGDTITFRLEAARFLQYMVRNLVGFLVEIGQGKRAVGEVDGIFAAKDRCAAGLTAPAHALTLMQIDY